MSSKRKKRKEKKSGADFLLSLLLAPSYLFPFFPLALTRNAGEESKFYG
jgi:hypothetical protein